jgi:acetoin utilization deacetylase AcuC-like enzyme
LRDDEYVAAFTDLIDPVARQFRPEFADSAGFDADYRDPRACRRRTKVLRMTRVMRSPRSTRRVVAAILEGGYDLGAPAPRTRGAGRARRTTLDDALATPQPRPGVMPARRQRPY